MCNRWGRRGWAGPAGFVVASVALGLLGTGRPVGAQDEESTVRLLATLAFGGAVADLTDPVVATVEVTASDLVDGELVFTRNDGLLAVRSPLQVPAGTTKSLSVLVPGGFGDAVTVELIADGEVVAERDVRVQVQNDVERVGVLPQLAARTPERDGQVTLLGGTGRAVIAELPVEILALGSAALSGGYDSIVGAAGDLTALADDQRRSLLLWVNGGGVLFLDDAASLDALPPEWRPVAPATYALAGQGEVRLLDGAATGDDWATFLQPTGNRWDSSMGIGFAIDPESGLVGRAGLQLPDLMPMIATLAIYAFVVGPFVYLLLRRRRRLTLGWVVVPVLAVGTAGGLVVAGSQIRQSGRPATASFVDSSPAGAAVLANALLIGRGGGDQVIDLPATWSTRPSTTWSTDPLPTDVTATADGRQRLTAALEAGQVVTRTFSGDTAALPLTLTAATTEDDIVGVVTNDTDRDMTDVVVFAGQGIAAVGTLAPGGSADWRVDRPDSFEPFFDPAGAAWPPPFDPDDIGDSRVDWGVLGTIGQAGGLDLTGVARVVGWAVPPSAPVDVGANSNDVAAWSVAVPVDPGRGPADLATIRRTVVRSPFREAGFVDSPEMVVRFVVPPNADERDLVVVVPDAGGPGQTLDVWWGDRWVAPEPADGVDGGFAVPVESVRSGVILVRMREAWDPGLVPWMTSAS